MDFTITLPSGKQWTPRYAASIDEHKCIGCGRDVLQLVGLTEDGERISVSADPDDDDEDEEYEKKIMTIAHSENCVGCEACMKICPKKCYTHAPASAT